MRSLAISLFLLMTLLGLVSAAPAKTRIATLEQDSILWVDLIGVASQKNLPVQWNVLTQQLSIGTDRKTTVWTLENNWIRTSSGIEEVQWAPRLIQGTWWAPMQTALQVFSVALRTPFVWDSTQQAFVVQQDKQSIGFKSTIKKESHLIELLFAEKPVYESFFHPPHFILSFQGTHADTASFNQFRQSTFVKKLKAVQEPSRFQLSIQVSEGIDAGEITESDSGRTLQILFRDSKAVVTQANDTIETKTTKKKIRTVIIDPGHGGKDPGALGKQSYEKDIVLAVGKKLRDKLRKAGFVVKMTREDDTFIELQDRPAKASKWGGDLFISLHCNAVEGEERRKKTDGYKVYILREAESEEDKAIARRENKAAELSSKKSKSEISPVEWILLENQLNAYTKDSEHLTEIMVDTFQDGGVRKMGSGAGQAGFMVLVGAFMPAALVELGFITHPEDEAYMTSSKGQDELAERMARSIISYRDSQ